MFLDNLSTSVLKLCDTRKLSYEAASERCDLSSRSVSYTHLVCEVILIDFLHRPVDDRFFDGLQPGLAPHDELAEGKHEVTFQCQRVLLIRIIQVDVQGVHICLLYTSRCV